MTPEQTAEIIYREILLKINGKYTIGSYKGTIEKEFSIEINRIVFHIYVEINTLFLIPDVMLFFDLYDTNGHKMKSDKTNVKNIVEKKLINHFKD